MAFGCGPPAHYYSPVAVARFAYAAGFRGPQVPVMVAIAFRESRFDANAVNCRSGAAGLWQILRGGSLDPRENARQAHALFLTQGYGAWGGRIPPYSGPGAADVARIARTGPKGARVATGGHAAPRDVTPGCPPNVCKRGSRNYNAKLCAKCATNALVGAINTQLGGCITGTCPTCAERHQGGATQPLQRVLCELPRWLQVGAGGVLMLAGLGVLVVSATGVSLPAPGPVGAVQALMRARGATQSAAPARPDTDTARLRRARVEAAESLARRRSAEAEVSEHYARPLRQPQGTQRSPVLVRDGRAVRV